MNRMELQIFIQILIMNHVIENLRPEYIVLWETWLNKKPTTIDTRYDIHRTIDADHQGVMILTKKNLVVKTYINEEPYLIAVEITYNETIFIVEVYMKEEKKVEIL